MRGSLKSPAQRARIEQAARRARRSKTIAVAIVLVLVVVIGCVIYAYRGIGVTVKAGADHLSAPTTQAERR